MSASSATAVAPRRRRDRFPSGLKLVAVIVAVIVLIAYLAAMAGLGFVRHRFATLPMHVPASAGPPTWLIVGEDYPDPETVLPGGTGTRADIIILATQTPSGLKVTSVPRDVVVPVEGWRRPDRLTLSWLKGPQVFVNSLCQGLGIPADHVIRVTAQSLEEVIDGLGGVDITVEKRVRAMGQFDLPAGVVHMNGDLALKFVRSRHARTLINGQWVEVPDGPQMRQRDSSQVFAQIIRKAKANPRLALSTAWHAAPDIGMDPQAAWLDMLPFLGFHGHIDSLPVETKDETTALITPETRAAVSALGYHGCTP